MGDDDGVYDDLQEWETEFDRLERRVSDLEELLRLHLINGWYLGTANDTVELRQWVISAVRSASTMGMIKVIPNKNTNTVFVAMESDKTAAKFKLLFT